MEEKSLRWAQGVWDNIHAKMQPVAIRSYDKIPYTSHDGVHDDKKDTEITWWTNGFWPGLLWILYANTGCDTYQNAARHAEETLDQAFWQYDGLHHDVGFLWNISSGVHYELLQDKKAYARTMLAANLLAGRFRLNGGYIRAWNNGIEGDENTGWSIIDCMMNLSLLYRASRWSKDTRFEEIARAHADKTMCHHVRPDGSVRHIVEYHPQTGAFIRELGGQGYAEGSSWSRGQAWALYGFALSYTHTKDVSYLDTAKRVAHYFIANVHQDWIPCCDFRSPQDPCIYDTTAAAIAACGLIEIAKHVEQADGQIYQAAALQMLQTLDRDFCDWNPQTDSLLQMGTERYHSEKGRHIPIIYGDYFFIEAIAKIRFPAFLAW